MCNHCSSENSQNIRQCTKCNKNVCEICCEPNTDIHDEEQYPCFEQKITIEEVAS